MPVAAVVAAFHVFVWVISALPEMAATAAVLGAVRGLWLWLVGQPSNTNTATLKKIGYDLAGF